MLTSIRQAARSLLRARWSTVLQVTTIAIGVGGLSAVIAVVGGVVLRPLPFDASEELVTIEVTSSRGFSISTSIPNLRDWRDRNRALATVGSWAGWNFRLNRQGESQILEGAAVYGDLFEVLRIRPALGRFFDAGETEPGSSPLVVLSHSLWQRTFAGDSTVVGQAIRLGDTPHTVVGILPRGFTFPLREPDVMVNMGSIGGLPWEVRSSAFGTRMYARLRQGVSFAAAASDIERVGREVKEENGPLTALPSLAAMSDYLLGGRDRQLFLLLGAVAIVMLIAVGNAGGLVLARAADRRRDAAVRIALGGGQGDIRRRFILENVLLALAGGVVGLVFAVFLVRALLPMLPDDLPRSLISRVGIDLPTIAVSLVACLTFGVLFGFVASRHASSPRLLESLRAGTPSIITPRTGARSALLVGEIALSLVLAVGAGLLLASFLKLRSTDKGFEEGGLLMARIASSSSLVSTREQWVAYHEALIERAAAVPGVTSAATSLILPLTDRSWELRVQPYGAPEAVEAGPSVLYNQVSNDYFETLSIPFVAGRTFTPVDRNGTSPVAVIDESMAQQFWPGQDPIGQRITINERGPDSSLIYRTVVGVVQNVRHYTLREPSRIQVYVPLQQTLGRWGSGLNVIVKTNGPPVGMIPPVRQVASQVDAGAAVWSIHPLSFYVDGSISAERALGLITVWLAVVASLVTAVGLFALVTFSVVQRRREIALRMALGSTPGEVVALMTWGGVSKAVAGVVIGLLAALGLSRMLAAFLFGVQAIDPIVYGGAALLLLGIAAAASLLPALSARRLAPASVLREE